MNCRYNPAEAAAWGPSAPQPNLRPEAIGLQPRTQLTTSDGPDRVFVGGIPYTLSDDQVRELLESFGKLKALEVIRDPLTGLTKGYCFCLYEDPNVTDVACAGLNGLQCGDKTLTVRRATQGNQKDASMPGGLVNTLPNLTFNMGVGMAPPVTGNPQIHIVHQNPTHVVVLVDVVDVKDLEDDEEYNDIVLDMREARV